MVAADTGPPPPLPPTFCLVAKTGCRDLGETSPAEPAVVSGGAAVRVRPGNTAAASALKTLELIVGSRPPVHTGDCARDGASPCPYAADSGSYLVRLNDTTLAAENGDLVTITAANVAGASQRAFVRIRRPVTFTGVNTPVLMRVAGKASGFRLNNLAPSLAAGPRFNFDNSTIKYLGVEPLLTVYSLPQETYSLATGGVADVGGLFQLGASYDFKDRHIYGIIGLRPDVLFGLVPGLRGGFTT